jgi:hypothetical protein
MLIRFGVNSKLVIKLMKCNNFFSEKFIIYAVQNNEYHNILDINEEGKRFVTGNAVTKRKKNLISNMWKTCGRIRLWIGIKMEIRMRVSIKPMQIHCTIFLGM